MTQIPGRIVVSERALRQTFAALAAEELGVRTRDVTARVADAAGRLDVDIEAPIRLAPLSATSVSASGSVTRPAALTTADSTRTRIHADGVRLTGAALAEVRVRLSGARIDEQRRVS